MLFKRRSFIILLIFVLIITGCNKVKKDIEYAYLASDKKNVWLLDDEYNNEKEISRGTKVEIVDKGTDYYTIKYEEKNYHVKKENVTNEINDVVKEETLYVRTPVNVYKDDTSIELVGTLKKGSKVDIVGYDKLNSDGSINKYKIKYKDTSGYLYSKYLVDKEEDAKKDYDFNGSLKIHATMGNSLGGGDATKLDYYPREKANFKDNVMPKEVRALYINAGAIKDVDKYLALAKDININAFVVDIKDDTAPAYPAEAMKKYSKTNYDKAINTYDEYKGYIKKLKDNGFYVIGRITLFKDAYYVKDNPDSAIKDTKSGKAYMHNSSYWPSAYNRGVWLFDVELAKESVKNIGFNEIQFDYVRFPDGINRLERTNVVNLQNIYEESKAEAIQLFLMYATDEIHNEGAYVSADVFGESAHNYVTGYGQYWPAISNIVDVISGMPYPDHFDAHQYGIEAVVWTKPYELLKFWGSLVAEKQKLIETPAKVRTWIQAYDTYKQPRVEYNTEKVNEEIDGLYANGLTDGYMTWNGGSNLEKYRSIGNSFKKEHIHE